MRPFQKQKGESATDYVTAQLVGKQFSEDLRSIELLAKSPRTNSYQHDRKRYQRQEVWIQN